MGDYEAAAGAFGDAVEALQPPDAATAFRYADALVLARDFESALAQANSLEVEAHQRLIRARVDQEEGRYESALEHFGAAAALWPNNPWARYYAGICAESLGLWDRALEEYRYSVRIDTGATDSRTRGAQLLSLQQDWNGAYRLLFFRAEDAPLERCLLYTSPSPRDQRGSRMPSSA